MTGTDPKLDPATEAAIERALDAAQLRSCDATASVVQLEQGTSAVEDDASGDGD
jgi:hypothetical protein